MSSLAGLKAFNGYNYASRDSQYKIGKKNLDNSWFQKWLFSYLFTTVRLADCAILAGIINAAKDSYLLNSRVAFLKSGRYLSFFSSVPVYEVYLAKKCMSECLSQTVAHHRHEEMIKNELNKILKLEFVLDETIWFKWFCVPII